MKNVYLVQVDVSDCSGTTVAYLPYTAGVLAAAAWTDAEIKSSYCFKKFIFLREDTDTVISQLENPAVIGFSNYCWNTEYNKQLAKKVKQLYPDCVIIFGGHNVPSGSKMLEEYEYIDILIHGEGEEVFRDVLKALTGGEMSSVGGISYRDGGSLVDTKAPSVPELKYPSPYIDGWFDEIIKRYPEITFNAILETSRGCPNCCAYCDWGLLKSKTRLFPLERVKAEIEWMAKNKIAFVWGADANFGMFERDLEIVDTLVEVKERTGYPERMRMNYAKNNFDNVFKIVRKFKECEFDRIGATLSFQSLSPEVLKIIGRTNMSLDFFREVQSRYNAEGLKAYSELILGLPGETYQSFIEGIGKLFEMGQHFVFEVYNCILLPNSELGRAEIVEKYKMSTVQVEILRLHFEQSAFAVPEYNNIVVATDTLSREDWIRCTVFYYAAKAFHGNGLLRAFAVYMFYEKGMSYHEFYEKLISYFTQNKDLLCAGLLAQIRQHADELSSGKGNRRLIFEPSGDVVWDDDEYLVLNCLYERECFYKEVKPFLTTLGIAEDVFGSLFEYQKNIMRVPCENSVQVSLEYDVHEYMRAVYVNEPEPLKKCCRTLMMTDTEVQPDWQSFGKQVIWYGRMGMGSYKNVIIND